MHAKQLLRVYGWSSLWHCHACVSWVKYNQTNCIPSHQDSFLLQRHNNLLRRPWLLRTGDFSCPLLFMSSVLYKGSSWSDSIFSNLPRTTNHVTCLNHAVSHQYGHGQLCVWQLPAVSRSQSRPNSMMRVHAVRCMMVHSRRRTWAIDRHQACMSYLACMSQLQLFWLQMVRVTVNSDTIRYCNPSSRPFPTLLFVFIHDRCRGTACMVVTNNGTQVPRVSSAQASMLMWSLIAAACLP